MACEHENAKLAEEQDEAAGFGVRYYLVCPDCGTRGRSSPSEEGAREIWRYLVASEAAGEAHYREQRKEQNAEVLAALGQFADSLQPRQDAQAGLDNGRRLADGVQRVGRALEVLAVVQCLGVRVGDDLSLEELGQRMEVAARVLFGKEGDDGSRQS